MRLKKMHGAVLAIVVCLALTIAALLVTHVFADSGTYIINGVQIKEKVKDTVEELQVSSDQTQITFQETTPSGIGSAAKSGTVVFTNNTKKAVTVNFKGYLDGIGYAELHTSEFDEQITEDNFSSYPQSEKYETFDDYLNNCAPFIENDEATYKIQLASGDSFEIFVQSNSTTTEPTRVVLNNFSVSDADSISVALEAPTIGSYTATSTDDSGKETSVSLTAGGADGSISFAAANGLTLKYTAPDQEGDQVFDYWRITDNNGDERTVSYDSEFFFAGFRTGDKVSLVTKDKDSVRYFAVGNRQYFNWEDAVAAAVQNATDKTVILRQDYAIPADATAGSYVTTEGGRTVYTIPSDVKFVVPRSDKDRGSFTTNIASNDSQGDKDSMDNTTLENVQPKVFRTLTVPANVTVRVEGKLNVNAAITGRSKYQAIVSGGYGLINLQSDAQLVLKSKSELYCFGFINGQGQVWAESGSKTYEPLQIADWGGGSNAMKFVADRGDNTYSNAFYFSQYYVQNIEAAYRIDAGATVLAVAVLRYTDQTSGMVSFMSAGADYIGENGLFRLKNNAYLIRVYDPDTDRTVYNIYGDMDTGSITVKIQGVDIISENWTLGLNGSLALNIKSGTTTLCADYMVLPGVQIEVAEGAKLTVSEDALISVWNSNDWNVNDTQIGQMLLSKTSFKGQKIYFSLAENGVQAPAYYTTADSYTQQNDGQAKTASGTYRVKRDPMQQAQIQVNGTMETYSNIFVTDVVATQLKTAGNTDLAVAQKQDCVSGTGIIVNHANTKRYCVQLDRKAGNDFLNTNEGTQSLLFPILTVNGTYWPFSQSNLTLINTVPMYSKLASSMDGTFGTIGEGTYYGSDAGWYQHHVTWKINDVSGTNLVTKDLYYDSDEVILPTEIDGQKYYYTAVETPEGVTAVKGDSSLNAEQSDGWTDIRLENVGKDAVVNVTAAPYEYSVTWEHYLNNWDDVSRKAVKTVFLAKNTENAEFGWAIADGALASDNVKVLDASTLQEVSGIKVQALASGENYVATASGIKQSVTIRLMTVSGSLPVNIYYSLPNDSGFALWGTYTAVKTSGNYSLAENIQVTTDNRFVNMAGYYVVKSVAADSVGTPITTAVVTTAANGSELSVQNVTGTSLDVYMTLTQYSYKVTFTGLPQGVTIAPLFVNADETRSIHHISGIENASETRYYFAEASAAECTANCGDGTELKVSGVQSDAVVNVTMKPYTYQIELRYSAGEGLIQTMYFEDGAEKTYVFGEKLNMGNIVTPNGNVKYFWAGTAAQAPNVTLQNCRADANTAAVTPAQITVSGVKADGVLKVNPQSFQYAVVFKDQTGVKTELFISRNTASYEVREGYILSEIAEATNGTAVVSADRKTVTVSSLTANSVVTFQTYQYQHQVNWSVDGVTKTDYLQQTESGVNCVASMTSGDAAIGTVAYTLENGKVTATYTAPANTFITSYNSATENATTGDTENNYTTLVLRDIVQTSSDTPSAITVTLTQKAYAHTVTFKDAASAVVKTVFVDENGYDAWYTAQTLATFEQAKKYIQSYTVAPDVTAVLDGRNSAGSKYGWTKLSIPAESAKSSDIVVTLTLADYTDTIQWIVNDRESSYNEYHYVTDMTTDTFTAPDSKMIHGATNASISDDKKSATYKGDGTAPATVSLTDEKPMVNYSVKDGDATSAGSAQSDNGSWTYTITQPGKVLDTVIIQGDQGVTTVNTLTKLEINNISKSITVEITLKDKPAQDIVIPPVNPLPDEDGNLVAYTGYTALWGDMNFQYYKNSAHYVYDAEKSEYVWVPGNTYAWRHATGSQTYTLNLQKDGKVEATDISVPNGSILLLNCSGKTISYTVKLDKSTATVNTEWAVMHWTTSGDGAVEKNGDNVITITLAPGQQMLVSGTMTGTTTEKFTNASVGNITVGMVEIH